MSTTSLHMEDITSTSNLCSSLTSLLEQVFNTTKPLLKLQTFGPSVINWHCHPQQQTTTNTVATFSITSEIGIHIFKLSSSQAANSGSSLNGLQQQQQLVIQRRGKTGLKCEAILWELPKQEEQKRRSLCCIGLFDQANTITIYELDFTQSKQNKVNSYSLKNEHPVQSVAVRPWIKVSKVSLVSLLWGEL